MNGSFIVSLDFELMWGVRDHRSTKEYGDAVLGGREAIPEMLSRFERSGIRATWATVGLLFAKNRDEMLEFSPKHLPNYANPNLSPYPDIENKIIGQNEAEDPLHFGASLLEKIADTPGQEIATHTFSHYYCLEDGADLETFDADINAAVAIAGNAGHRVRSIVFPRNQTAEQFIDISRKLGVNVYRGDAKGWLYRPRSGDDTTTLFRLIRFLDGAVPVGPNQVVQPIHDGSTLNVPASRFLRPWSKKLAMYQSLHLRRIEAEMELAARLGQIYHLWWHPHNFGRNTVENFAQLDRVISCFERCRDKFGMTSKNMRDIAVA